MNKFIRAMICVLITLTLFGCNNDTETTVTDQDPVIQDQVGETDGPVKTEEMSDFYSPSQMNQYGFLDVWENESYQKAIGIYKEFALKDFRSSLEKGENEIVSPLSLYYVLAITANGAKGNTKNEMETALGMSVNDLNLFLNEFDTANNRDYAPVFNKANALWFNKDLGQLKQEYVDTIRKYYGDSIFERSFGDRQKITKEVNQWSSDQTDGAIDQIVSEDDLDKDSYMLLLNALVAGGPWSIPFDTKETFTEDFNCYDNSKKTVEMMHQTLFGYWSDKNSEGFAKDLGNGSWFVAILPNQGIDIYDYIDHMDPNTFSDYIENVHYEDVVGSFKPNYEWNGECPIVDQHYTNLSFPKFEYEKEYELEETLKEFGLKNVFDPKTCDFSGISDGEIYIQKVKQKCKVEVDEEKAVAAAVTLEIMGKGGGDCLEVRDIIYHDVVFNRPFLFAFVSDDRQTPLFIGIVNRIGEDGGKAFRIENIAGKINIRNKPSTTGEKVGMFEKGQIVYAFEIKKAGGYTWYRIGTDKWVADKNGEWIKTVD